MITVLSSILGFIGAMVPEILSLFRERADRRFEKEMAELQLRQQAMQHSDRLEEIRLQGMASEMDALYRTYRSGIEWVDALNGTVRPLLAYAFFLLYAATKYLLFIYPHGTPIGLLWTEEDHAIFAGIISFYFGQRAFSKLRR